MLDVALRFQIQKVGDDIAKWALLVFFFALPFFLVLNDWVAITQAKMILVLSVVAIAAVAWIVGRIAEGAMRIPKSFLLYAGTALPIAYLVSALVASRTWGSFIGTGVEQDTVVSVFAFYLLFAISALVLSKSLRDASLSLRALVWGGGVLTLIQLLRLIFPELSDFNGALSNTAVSAIGSLHDLAIFLGLLLFLTISFKDSDGASVFWRIVRVAAGIISGLLLLFINAPDVWVVLAALGVLYGAYEWHNARKTETPGYLVALKIALPYFAVAIIALGFLYGGARVYDKLPARLQLAQAEVRPSWQGTFTVGWQSFKNVRDFAVGTGPNTFAKTWGQNKPLSVNATQFWSTDFNSGIGLIPTSLISTGLLGLLALGIFLAALLWSIVRFVRYRDPAMEQNKLAGIVLAGAVYLFVFQIVYVPGAAVSALSFILFGLFVALQANGGSLSVGTFSLDWLQLKGKLSSAALAVFGLLVLFGAAESLRALASDALVNRAVVTYGRTNDVDKAGKDIAAALSYFGNNDRAHRTGVELGLQKLKQLLAQNTATDAARAQLQDALKATLQHGISAVSSDSGNYQNWLTVGRLYGELSAGGIKDADKNARDAYARAQVENPTSPLPLLGLAQLDLAAGDAKSARAHLNSALGVKADLTAAHFLLSQLNAKGNDLPKAQEEAVIVVQLAPQDPLAWYNLGLILYSRKSYDNAAGAFARAVELQPNYANAIFVLGLSFYQTGKNAEAIAAIDEVARLNPADPLPKQVSANIKAGKDPFKGLNAGQ